MTPFESQTRAQTPGNRGWILALGAFSTISAAAGGSALLASPRGNQYVPLTLLEGTGFDSFLVPGLLLLLVVAGTSLACTIFAWRRSSRTIDVAWLAGGTMTAWIVAEAALMAEVHFLHVLYGAIGLSLLALAAIGARVQNEPRHRWVFTVTVGEGLGFLAPLATALWLIHSDASDSVQSLGIGLAGGIEGALLGAGQAYAWPLPIRRGRYIALTALGATIVWLALLFGRLALVQLVRPAPVLAGVLGLVLVVVGLGTIGALQVLELGRVSAQAGRWFIWSALAWALALPCSFFPSPLVNETTPWSTQLPLWGTAGFGMAYIMALVTERGVQALRRVETTAA